MTGGLREVLFGGAGGATRAADAGLLLARFFVGVALAAAHGVGKVPPSPRFVGRVAEMGFPEPLFFAWAAGLSELVGGALIAAGLLTRPSAFFVLITMLVAAFLREGPAFVEKEKALLFAAFAVMLLFTGAGRYSLDAWVGGRGRPHPGGRGGGT